MKKTSISLILTTILLSCNQAGTEPETKQPASQLIGTWKLLQGTLIEKGDTTITDYTKKLSFIKIINESHFSFLNHDLTNGKDSPAVFSAGGGSYTLKDSTYTEHLEYCNDRQWEGHDFPFTVTIKNDTLTQYGVEKVESAGVNRVNIEKYVRVKK